MGEEIGKQHSVALNVAESSCADKLQPGGTVTFKIEVN